jgi:hypothetical protein
MIVMALRCRPDRPGAQPARTREPGPARNVPRGAGHRVRPRAATTAPRVAPASRERRCSRTSWAPPSPTSSTSPTTSSSTASTRASATSSRCASASAAWTYGEVAERARALAAVLSRGGVRHGGARADRSSPTPALRVDLLRRLSRRRGHRDGQPRRARGRPRVPPRVHPRLRRVTVPASWRPSRWPSSARRGSAPCSSPRREDRRGRRGRGERPPARRRRPRRVPRPRARHRRRCSPTARTPRAATTSRVALHLGLHGQAQGRRPHPPRLRLQHRALRAPHGGLPARRRVRERPAPLLRLRHGDQPHVPLPRGRRRWGSSPSGPRWPRSPTPSRATARPSSPTSPP